VAESPAPIVSLVDRRVDLDTGTVRQPGREPVPLSAIEQQLLAWLVAHPREPLARERLLVEVWGYRPGVASRTVDTTMGRLRAKLEREPEHPRHLLSVRGLGYRFEPLDPASSPGPASRPAGRRFDRAPTAFVGRQPELDFLLDQLQDQAQVLTVIGPGGMGKTRLARRVADAWDAGPQREAWFVDLTEARDGAGIIAAMGAALGITLADSERHPARQVAEALAPRPGVLMVMDNAEHLVDAARPLLVLGLEHAPMVRWLVTSRQRLRVQGEQVLELGPLGEDEGVQLFVDRARAARPDYAPDAAEQQDIVALCARLDGLPLALELAAARARLLSPSAMRQRLEAGQPVLGTHLAGAPDRHATLQAAIQGSWDLLSPALKQALVQVTVFRGGFDLEAAEAVLRVPALDALDPGLDALDAVEQLVDRSLLRCTDTASGPRFGLYVAVRSFVEAQASQDADTQARHAAHYGALAQAWAKGFGGPDIGASVAGLAREWDNLQVLSEGSVPPADRARAALGLGVLMARTGPYQALETLLDRGVDAAVEAGEGDLEARLRLERGQLHRRAGRPERALEDYRRGLRAVPGTGPQGRAAHLRCCIAILDSDAGRHAQAEAGFDEALEEARFAGDAAVEGVVHTNRAVLRLRQGRLDEAQAAGETALALHRLVGSRLPEANTLHNLAVVELRRMSGDRAAPLLRQALALDQSVGSNVHTARIQANLAIALALVGQLEEALEHSEAAVRFYRNAGFPAALAQAEINHADALLQAGRAAETEALVRHLLATMRPVEVQRYRATAAMNLALALAEQDRLPEALDTIEQAWRELCSRGPADLLAMCAGYSGVLLWLAGRPSEGRCRLDRAVVEARRAGQQRPLVLWGAALLLAGEQDPELRAQVRQAATDPPGPTVLELLAGHAPPARALAGSVDLRLLADMAARRAPSPPPAVQVWVDGSAFQLGLAPPVPLRPGSPQRAVLAALARAGGAAVPWTELHAAAWPDRPAPDHPAAQAEALKRLRVAIARLRGAGLEAVEKVELARAKDPPAGLVAYRLSAAVQAR